MFCFRTIGLGYFGLTQKQVSLCTYYIIFLNLESVECWNDFFFHFRLWFHVGKCMQKFSMNCRLRGSSHKSRENLYSVWALYMIAGT